MRTARDIRNEVVSTLGDHVAGFDVDGITTELMHTLEFDARTGYGSIDELEPDAYNAILSRHDTSE